MEKQEFSLNVKRNGNGDKELDVQELKEIVNGKQSETKGIEVPPLTDTIEYDTQNKSLLSLEKTVKIEVRMKNRTGKFLRWIKDGEGLLGGHFAIIKIEFDPEYPTEFEVKIKEHGETTSINLPISEIGEKIVTHEPGAIERQEGKYLFCVEWLVDLFMGPNFQQILDEANYGKSTKYAKMRAKAVEYNAKIDAKKRAEGRGQVSPKFEVENVVPLFSNQQQVSRDDNGDIGKE